METALREHVVRDLVRDATHNVIEKNRVRVINDAEMKRLLDAHEAGEASAHTLLCL